MGGSVIRWLRDEMKLIHDAADSEYFARKIKSSEGVYFVPAFSGLGAPEWDMHAKGTIVGLTAGTGKNHIIRASLESVAYQTEDVLSAMNAEIELFYGKDNSKMISVLRVDGGASANSLLMQMQSDFSALTVQVSANSEATAQGAAFLAGLGVGFFESRAELKTLVSVKKSFEPQICEKERKELLDGWHRAVKACRKFSERENNL